jgi:hypothetical protein
MDSPISSTFDIIEQKVLPQNFVELPTTSSSLNQEINNPPSDKIPSDLDAARASEFVRAYFKLTDDPKK